MLRHLHSTRSPTRLRLAIVAAILASVPVLSGCGSGRDLAAAGAERFDVQAVTAGGVSIDVAAWRSGSADAPRIIYVHGTPGSGAAFVDYLADPIPGFESITFDRPGFGASAGGGAWTSFADQAAAVEPLLVERDGRWPILVGHSLGGPIVARVAADHPDRVGAIVVLAGSLDPSLEKPQWFNHLADTVLIRLVLSRSLRHSNDELMAAAGQTRALDGVLDRVRCPVAILHGDRDGLVPVANVQYMQGRFAGVPLDVRILRGAGHLLPWQHEAEVRAAILRAAAMRETAVPAEPDVAADPPAAMGIIETP